MMYPLPAIAGCSTTSSGRNGDSKVSSSVMPMRSEIFQTRGYTSSVEESAIRAMAAGVNMEMAIGQTDFNQGLPAALRQSRISVTQLDEAVRPILEMKFRLGLFDRPYVNEARVSEIQSAPEHRIESRVAAGKTMVLLRNEGNLLPLKKSSYHKIAVIGPLADSQFDTFGP